MESKNIYAVIMAGGRGERFWPQSRMSTPKPLLRLVGELTLLEQTVERLKKFLATENILIITNKNYVAPIQGLLPDFPADNIIGEPVPRDTGPCVALAAAIVSAKCGQKNPLMIMLPADHVINDKDTFARNISESANFASKTGKIITVGINPSSPATGYGYINCGNDLKLDYTTKFSESLGFTEKPDATRALEFVKSGKYEWNSGIFVWPMDTLETAMKRYSPELHKIFLDFRRAVSSGRLESCLEEIFHKLPKISIDYALMEKVENMAVAHAEFDWDDVGAWTALRNQNEPDSLGNVAKGLYAGLDSENNILINESRNHLLALIDLSDLIVVHTDDATLICPAGSAQRVKQIVQLISANPELRKYL